MEDSESGNLSAVELDDFVAVVCFSAVSVVHKLVFGIRERRRDNRLG
jgi:hypothetical protein